ncbi:MAG: peroxiredoxin family protein [Nitrospinota bacterium]
MDKQEAGPRARASGLTKIGLEDAGAASAKMRRAGLIAAVSVVAALILVLFGKVALKKSSDFRRTEEGYRLFFTIPKTREPAPEFSLPALDGKRVRLSDLRGRVVFLSFRTTW